MTSEPAAPPGTVRVVGIDPGLTRCGVGVVDGPPSRPVHCHHETLRTPSDDPLATRLDAIFTGIEAAVARWRPDVVAVERVLFSSNVRTAMATGQAAGIALLAAARAGVAVREITPTRVKATVTGHGGADKDGVARMVTAHLRLDEVPRPADAADALAVAIAGLLEHRSQVLRAGADRAASARPASTSWEDHLAARALPVVGGTRPDARASRGGRS